MYAQKSYLGVHISVILQFEYYKTTGCFDFLPFNLKLSLQLVSEILWYCQLYLSHWEACSVSQLVY